MHTTKLKMEIHASLLNTLSLKLNSNLQEKIVGSYEFITSSFLEHSEFNCFVLVASCCDVHNTPHFAP